MVCFSVDGVIVIMCLKLHLLTVENAVDGDILVDEAVSHQLLVLRMTRTHPFLVPSSSS